MCQIAQTWIDYAATDGCAMGASGAPSISVLRTV
jgi:hypothetical protein